MARRCAARIVAARAKDNQPKLGDALEAAFPMPRVVNFDGDVYVTDEKSRGRQETRDYIVSEYTPEFQELSYEWPGLKTVGVVMSFRQEGNNVPEVPMIRYQFSRIKRQKAGRSGPPALVCGE